MSIEGAVATYEAYVRESGTALDAPVPVVVGGRALYASLRQAYLLDREMAEFMSTIGVRRFLQENGETVTATPVPDPDEFEDLLDPKIREAFRAARAEAESSDAPASLFPATTADEE